MPELPDTPEAVREHLALALVPGLGPKLTAALLERFGSAGAARRASAAELLQIPHIGERLAAQLSASLRTVDIAPELEAMRKHGASAVPLGFPGYPPPLARVGAPPPLLYFRGEWTDADVNAIGIVGSRACTPYGLKVASLLARGLARAGYTVVSGLARGIDAAAHLAALEAEGRTIAVLAGGLSRIYPPEHADLAARIATGRGCLISETPMNVDPQPGMFPARNRIISGLSRAIIVVEANARSGALITARHAAEQGREVYAVPGPVDRPESAGCLELLRGGARLVRSADDVLEDLKGLAADDFADLASVKNLGVDIPRRPEQGNEPGADAPRGSPMPELSSAEQRIFDALSERRHADELARETGLAVSELATLLMRLDLRRVVRRLPGNFYERR